MKCANCNNEFIIDEQDKAFYNRMSVPEPTFCPQCRLIRRFTFRNERSLYKATCVLCKKDIISLYKDFPSCCYDCWWSDEWEALKYGRDYDFNRPFFEQFKELMHDIPMLNLWGFNNTNCNYVAHVGWSKNSYLSSSIVRSEDVYYSYSVDDSKDIFDSFITKESELCYENINTEKCYNSCFIINSRNCLDSWFLFDCNNCNNCVLCTNLKNKKFHIRNKPYSKEDYLKEIKKLNLQSYDSLKELREEFKTSVEKAVHRYADIINSKNCTGDNIRNCKNVKNCFVAGNSEDLKYCWRVLEGMKDCHDVSGALNSELCYETIIAANNNYRSKFYIQSNICEDIEYCFSCWKTSNLFGCVGLKDKEYCIFNKQYTKEEYNELVPKIRKHMNDMPYIDKQGRVYKYGEFFPYELSSFAYNETVAQEYFPLTKEQALKQGFKWKEQEDKDIKVDIYELPDDVKDDILGKVIQCEHNSSCDEPCTKAFKIIPQELNFYKRMNLPLPRLCPSCRHFQRLKQRNPLRLWKRQCRKCNKDVQSPYEPSRPETIYCEECYQQEII